MKRMCETEKPYTTRGPTESDNRLICAGHFERVIIILVEGPMPHVNVHGVDLYYEVHGRGEPLVLLHNGLGCTKNFALQVAEFSKHFRVITYDRHGYGRSTHMVNLEKNWLDESVGELLRFLDRLKIKKAHLCGICVGGAIALLFAAKNTARVGNVAVAGTCCYGEDKMASKASKLYPLPENLPIEWLQELAKCHGKTYGKDLYRVFHKTIEEANGYPFKGYDLRPTLPHVRSPVIVIYGDRDQLFDLEQALTMHRCLERSDVCIIPNCGHLPNEERPQEFNRAVLNSLRRH